MRVIVHLDADAFFASVEQASDPKLRGQPVAVGGEKRGIIASASYEARRFGIYTPMPSVQARRLCPKLILLPGDFERYEQFSHWMFGYALDFTPDVEQTSIDEGYFDLSAVRKPPAEVAQTIRRAIWQKLKLSVSEGIGSNKLVSAVASKLHKPAAFEEVPAGREADFLAPLRNQWLPGVGPKLGQQLNAAGLAHIGQLAGTPVELLELMVGRQALTRTPKLSRERAQRTLRDRAGEGLALENCHPVRLLASSLTVRHLRPFAAIPLRNSGLMLRQFARGIDERPVVSARTPAKSFSQQETFAADVTDEEFAQATLRRMVDMTCC